MSDTNPEQVIREALGHLYADDGMWPDENDAYAALDRIEAERRLAEETVKVLAEQLDDEWRIRKADQVEANAAGEAHILEWATTEAKNRMEAER